MNKPLRIIIQGNIPVSLYSLVDKIADGDNDAIGDDDPKQTHLEGVL